jgi:S1-C subfamily serine protease
MSAITVARPGGIQAALRRYRSEPASIRLFVLARHLLAPLRQVAAHVPARGRILDLGCGHGAIIWAAQRAGYTNVTGVDASPEQVAAAKDLGIAGVRQGDLLVSLDGQPIEGVADLQRLLRDGLIGRRANLDVVRGGRVVTLDVVPLELREER